MKLNLLILLITTSCAKLFAQDAFEYIYNLLVIKNNDTLKNPWLGGLNNPQFNFIDLNDDGLKDIHLFDQSESFNSGKNLTFLNTGKKNEFPYIYNPEYETPFPTNNIYFCTAKDFNCDDIPDLFVNKKTDDYGFPVRWIEVLKGSYNNESQLTFNSYAIIKNINLNEGFYPAIVDVNFDGLLDFITFDASNSTLVYYKNVAIEMYGNCDSLIFNEVGCWGKMKKADAFKPDFNLGVSCKNAELAFNQSNFHQKELHFTASISAIDIGNDEDIDIFSSTNPSFTLSFYKNSGNKNEEIFTEKNDVFPDTINPVYQKSSSCSRFVFNVTYIYLIIRYL